MKKIVLSLVAVGALGLWVVQPAHAQWRLGPSQHEPCWSAANPVRCNGTLRPHNPAVFERFKMDKGAPQSYWYNR